jgi:integrase
VAALGCWKEHQQTLRKRAGEAWRQTVELSSGQHLRNDLVFTRPSGEWILPWKPSHAFWRICARAGVPRVRLHNLRHTHATLLLKAGVNPKVVSERLGHQSIGITLDLYGHVLPAMGREAPSVFADIVGGRATSAENTGAHDHASVVGSAE